MKNLTTIDKATAKELGARAAELLAKLETEYNVKVRLGGGKYDPDGTFSPKIEIALLREGGETVTKEAIDFKHYAADFGLDPSDLGKVISLNGHKCKIIGLKTRSPRRPILVEEVGTGRRLVTSETSVQRAVSAS